MSFQRKLESREKNKNIVDNKYSCWILACARMILVLSIINMKDYYVYILASKRNGTLYTGVTNNLSRRVYEHKEGLADSFTKKYNVKMLVYYEITNSIEAAINRESCIKAWKRKWKLEVIESINPEWKDLYYNL
jgi:putative endonuclease